MKFQETVTLEWIHNFYVFAWTVIIIKQMILKENKIKWRIFQYPAHCLIVSIIPISYTLEICLYNKLLAKNYLKSLVKDLERVFFLHHIYLSLSSTANCLFLLLDFIRWDLMVEEVGDRCPLEASSNFSWLLLLHYYSWWRRMIGE